MIYYGIGVNCAPSKGGINLTLKENMQNLVFCPFRVHSDTLTRGQSFIHVYTGNIGSETESVTRPERDATRIRTHTHSHLVVFQSRLFTHRYVNAWCRETGEP